MIPRVAERYRRLLALAASPNPHEAGRAQALAVRLAAQHDLASASLPAFTPAGSILVRDRPWWCAIVITHAASHVATDSPLPAGWRARGGDMALDMCGQRSAIGRVRALYAGARFAIVGGLVALRPATLDEADAFCLAAAAAFGRNLWEIAEYRRRPRRTDLALWEAPPEDLPLAPADASESDRLAVVDRAGGATRRLILRHQRAVRDGVALGQILGSRLDLRAPPTARSLAA